MDKREEVLSLFRELKLKAFAENYERLACGNKSVDEILAELCLLETERRYSTKVKSRIKQAGFPKVKTLAMLDYALTPMLPKQTVDTLATCKFVEKKENVILVGDSGGGKTHLAIALGIEACKKLHPVKFFTVCQLANLLTKEHDLGDIDRFMGRLKRYSVIIVDEIGYVTTISKKGAELLFQVFSDRYEAGSLIITSNLVFNKWTEVFLDKTMTTALLDRLTHHATIIKYDWGSVRFNQAKDPKTERKKPG